MYPWQTVSSCYWSQVTHNNLINISGFCHICLDQWNQVWTPVTHLMSSDSTRQNHKTLANSTLTTMTCDLTVTWSHRLERLQTLPKPKICHKKYLLKRLILNEYTTNYHFVGKKVLQQVLQAFTSSHLDHCRSPSVRKKHSCSLLHLTRHTQDSCSSLEASVKALPALLVILLLLYERELKTGPFWLILDHH